MGDIIPIRGGEFREMTVGDVIKRALDADLEGVIVIGYTKENGYLAFSMPCVSDAVLMLERVKLKFLMEDFKDDEDF